MAELITVDQIEQKDASALADVGVTVSENNRSGTFVLRNHQPLCIQAHDDGLEMLPIGEALRQYDWLREKYYWKTIDPDQDDITSQVAAEQEPQGYFIRVKKGIKIARPAQTALLIAHANLSQKVHNVVVLEEGAELHLITGCTTRHDVHDGLHMAVTEMYIGQNATLTYTMVHSWGPQVIVRPRTAVTVETEGRYINNYVSLQPALDIQSNPRTYLNGIGASAKYMTVIMGSEGSLIDTGGEVYLNGEDSSAELTHRGVCLGGHIYQRGFLVGNARCRAHVDCAGLLLDAGKDGFIESVPGIKSFHSEAEMSHEAAVGRVSAEHVEYLQSRGLDEREAISMIIRGFLDADIEGLGKELDAGIAHIVELAGHGEK